MKWVWCFAFVLSVQLILVLAKEKKENSKAKEASQTTPMPEIRRSYPEDYQANINVTAQQATFRKFIHHRHKQRLGALNDLKKQTYSKQYKMLETILPTLFENVLSQRVILESSGYIPGGDWPLNMTIRDAMTHVVEAGLFLGETFLRMPDVIRRVLKGNKEWDLLTGWTWTFTTECLVYLDEKMHIPINTMGQELGFIEKDPEMLKRYRDELEQQTAAPPDLSNVEKLINEAKQHMKAKKKLERGPKMSSASGDL